MSDSQDVPVVREPQFEDLFYPGDPSELRSEVLHRVQGLSPTPGVCCALSPCAGHAWAGDLMAQACASFRDMAPQRIILIAQADGEPVQRVPVAWLPESPVFRTPLGDSPVDQEYVACLLDLGTSFRVGDVPHLQSWRLEVQLPFLQHLYPRASVVPILVEGPPDLIARALAGAIAMADAELPAKSAILCCGNISGLRPRPEAEQEADRVLEVLLPNESHWPPEPSGHRTDNPGILALFARLTRGRDKILLGRKSGIPEEGSLISSGKTISYGAIAAN